MADVTITVRTPRVLDDCTEFGASELLADGTLVIDFPPVARVHLTVSERSIVVEPFPGTNESIIRHVVVDLALARWFARAGRPALHATAVEIDGGVVALLGPSGRGKSTLSGALVASGGRWIADDLLLLSVDGSAIRAIPTVVSTRLRSDSAEALGIDHCSGEVISSRDAKRRWDVPGSSDSSPLTCVFVLDRRDDTDGPVVVGPMANGEVIAELASHWLLTDTGVVAPSQFFSTVTTLLRSSRVVRLSYPSSFASLPEVVRVIIETASPCRRVCTASTQTADDLSLQTSMEGGR